MKIKVNYKSKTYDIYYSTKDNNVIIDQIYSGSELLYDCGSNFESKSLDVPIELLLRILYKTFIKQ